MKTFWKIKAFEYFSSFPQHSYFAFTLIKSAVKKKKKTTKSCPPWRLNSLSHNSAIAQTVNTLLWELSRFRGLCLWLLQLRLIFTQRLGLRLVNQWVIELGNAISPHWQLESVAKWLAWRSPPKEEPHLFCTQTTVRFLKYIPCARTPHVQVYLIHRTTQCIWNSFHSNFVDEKTKDK